MSEWGAGEKLSFISTAKIPTTLLRPLGSSLPTSPRSVVGRAQIFNSGGLSYPSPLLSSI